MGFSELTSDYLFCRFVRSLALVGRLGSGHIGVSKWREELWNKETDMLARLHEDSSDVTCKNQSVCAVFNLDKR